MHELEEKKKATETQVEQLNRLIGRIEVGVRTQQTLALTRDAA